MSSELPPIRVAVTGAAGQIGYALLFRIASGAAFGPNQPVILHLIEIEPAMEALKGVVMELEDGAFPLLRGIVPTCSLEEGFKDVNWALLVGSVPRKQGMERKDLLKINGNIFTAQGKAIAANAAKDVRTLVVGNPCNTNALIACLNAEGIPTDQFFAMTRLDENRAKTQLALRTGKDVKDVKNLAIWGNHSSTMVPDYANATIDGKNAAEAVADDSYLEGEFFSTIQQRGAAIIKARGLSSAASAANAAIDTVYSLATPTPEGEFHSVAVYSKGDYGIPEGIMFSFPIRTNDGKTFEIVQGLEHSDFLKGKIAETVKELEEEKAAVTELGLIK